MMTSGRAVGIDLIPHLSEVNLEFHLGAPTRLRAIGTASHSGVWSEQPGRASGVLPSLTNLLGPFLSLSRGSLRSEGGG